MNPFEQPFTPLPAHPTDATVFTCGLCGARFTHGGEVCGACPMTTKCELVKCPNCGFQFPRGSRLLGLLSRLFGRKRSHP
jgi:hypothetical protein